MLGQQAGASYRPVLREHPEDKVWQDPEDKVYQASRRPRCLGGSPFSAFSIVKVELRRSGQIIGSMEHLGRDG
jgi:hypothetical protein